MRSRTGSLALVSARQLHDLAGEVTVLMGFVGISNQPWPALPRYEFLSTYFSGFDPSSRLGETVAALRPGLFLEGDWKLVSGLNGGLSSPLRYVVMTGRG